MLQFRNPLAERLQARTQKPSLTLNRKASLLIFNRAFATNVKRRTPKSIDGLAHFGRPTGCTFLTLFWIAKIVCPMVFLVRGFYILNVFALRELRSERIRKIIKNVEVHIFGLARLRTSDRPSSLKRGRGSPKCRPSHTRSR